MMIKSYLGRLLVLIVLLSGILYISLDISSEEMIYDQFIEIEVRGEVAEPGIIELPKNSRFEDLLKVIDLSENADISGFSMQNVLYNRQLIVIPEIKQESLISINSGTLEELCTLPGIGPSLASRIIEYRSKIGSFLSIEDIKEVKGIGDVKFAKIKDFITL